MVKDKSRCCSCDNLCTSFSVFFLIIINVAIGFGGLSIVGFGVYGLANFAEFEGIISNEVIIYTLCIGIALFILSMIAIFGALNRMKKFLTLYIILLLALTVSEVIVLIVSLEYIGVIAGASDAAGDGGSQSLNSREAVVNNFLLRSYQTCCATNEEICNVDPANEEFCASVQLCSTDGVAEEDACILDEDVIVDVDFSVCTAMTKLDSSLIGPPTEGGCGEGESKVFLEKFIEIIEAQFSTGGIFFAVLVGVEFLLILFTMFILLGKKVDYDNMGWLDFGNEPVAVAEPISNAELQDLRRRSARPVSFTAAGVQSGGNRRSAQPNTNRLSNNRRSAQPSANRTSVSTTNRSSVSTPQPQPAAVSEEPDIDALRERLTAKVPNGPPRTRGSVGRKAIADDPNAINGII